jgi:hypothetical protein
MSIPGDGILKVADADAGVEEFDVGHVRILAEERGQRTMDPRGKRNDRAA